MPKHSSVPPSYIHLTLHSKNRLGVYVLEFEASRGIPRYVAAGELIDLDHKLGNHEGCFHVGGHRFSYSARNIRVAGNAIHAELASSDGLWFHDAIAVDVQLQDKDKFKVSFVEFQNYHGERRNHSYGPMVLLARSGLGDFESPNRLATAIRNVQLCAGRFLIADVYQGDGSYKQQTLDLNEILGNNDGRLDRRGSGFFRHASDTALLGSKVVSWLPRIDRTLAYSEIELHRIICCQGGRLMPTDYARRARNNWKPQTFPWDLPRTEVEVIPGCRNIALGDRTILMALCRNNHGEWCRSAFDLDKLMDVWSDQWQVEPRFRPFPPGRAGCKDRVRDVRLDGSVLRAKTDGYKMEDLAVDLKHVLQNVDGVLTLKDGLMCPGCVRLFRGGVLHAPEWRFMEGIGDSEKQAVNAAIQVKPYDVRCNPNCGICKLSRELIEKKSPDPSIRHISFKFREAGMNFLINPPERPLLLDVVFAGTDAPSQYTVSFDRKLYPSEMPFAFQGMKRRRPRNHTHDPNERLSLLKQFLIECEGSHQKCQHNKAHKLPRRVLNIDDDLSKPIRVLEDCDRSEVYACLSHRWGQIRPKTLDHSSYNALITGIPLSDLPKTFRDAITLCHSLGVRYLWIDSLCILQDDREDWHRESSKMADYYGNCYLCIAATSSSNPEGGLATRNFAAVCYAEGIDPEGVPYRLMATRTGDIADLDHFSTSFIQELSGTYPLLARAWTFQERWLAPRVLHCCPDEYVLECAEKIWCECGRIWAPRLRDKIADNWRFDPWNLDTKEQGTILTKTQAEDPTWMNLVAAYSALSITFSSDRLPAISGMARRFQSLHPEGDKLGRYIAGMWESSLSEQLSWFVGRSFQLISIGIGTPLLPNELRRSEYAGAQLSRWESYVGPSWSWLSVRERVMHRPANDSRKSLFELVQYEVKLSTADPFSMVTEGCHLQLRASLRKSRWESAMQKRDEHTHPIHRMLDLQGVATIHRDVPASTVEFLPDYTVTASGPHSIPQNESLYVFPLATEGVSNINEQHKDESTLEMLRRCRYKICLVLRKCEDKKWSNGLDVFERVGYLEYASKSGTEVNVDLNEYEDREFVLI